jgi:hypothetical protein
MAFINGREVLFSANIHYQAIGKKTIFGNCVVLEDVADNGHTVNTKIESENLIPFPYFVGGANGTLSYGGISGYIANDGGIMLSGTTNIGVTIVLQRNCNYGKNPIVGDGTNGEYVISGSVEPALVCYSATDETLYIRIESGTINATIYPKIERGTTAKFYTPNIDGTAVEITAMGKNIIDPPWVSGDPYTTNGVTFDTQNDNSVVITGKATASAYFKFETDKKLAHGTYTLKVFADNDCVANGCVVPTMNKFDASNKSTYMGADTGNGYTFTVTKEDAEAYVYGLHFTVNASKNYTFTGERFYAMLVYGDKVPTEYEPFKSVGTYNGVVGDVISIPSISPTMTMQADVQNINIVAEYERDLEKAVERLEREA